MNSMKYEMRSVDDLIPYARNARTHSPEQIQKLASSIKEFGFINPVIISEDGGVLAGHGRILAAKKLGITEVPCVIESHLTEAQKRAYILADNRLALDAGWDEEMLKIELSELKELNFNMDIMGFDAEELKHFMDSDFGDMGSGNSDDGGEEKEIEVDEEVESIVQPGDLWLLGEHRLICGDSTKQDVVKRLFKEDRPNLMVTDPPYGVNYDPKVTRPTHHSKELSGKVYNDDRCGWKESYELFPGNIAYVWHAPTNSDTVMQDIKACGYTINSVIVWNKQQMIVGWSDYHWKHEACIYATRGNHNWQGSKNETTVWDIETMLHLKKEEGAWGHGTQKPIECMRRPIENNSEAGEWVYDPFCGSGTTFIACERTKRKCLGIELSPHYCDAIIRRWESETGKQAVLDGDGALFDELASEDNV